MARHSATLARILGCWLACLISTTGAASKGFLMRSSLHKTAAAGRQWRTLNGQRGPPASCNCQGKSTNTNCAGNAAAQAMMNFLMATTTTMQAPAQPPIPPPPPPVPLPGPPPPLPLGPAKPLPGLPGLPGISVANLPTLGPPPLFRMTPAPTWPPPMTTTGAATTPGPTTPAWVETPMGLIAGTTPNPFLKFMTTPRPWVPAPGPAPGPAPAPGLFGAAPATSYPPPMTPVEDIRARITAIYMANNPMQVASVPTLMTQRKGQEKQFYLEVCKQYNVTPDPAAVQRYSRWTEIREGPLRGAGLAPAPAPAVALVQGQPRAWTPLSFLYRSLSRGTQGQSTEQECDCPCTDLNSAASVDAGFNSVLDQNTGFWGGQGNPMYMR